MILIRNLSALILFFGIIMMTFYISRSYNFNFESKEKKISLNDKYLNELSKRPSKIFKNMFEQPTVWMGYADNDTKDSKYDQNYYTTVTGKNTNSLDSIFSDFNPNNSYKDIDN